MSVSNLLLGYLDQLERQLQDLLAAYASEGGHTQLPTLMERMVATDQLIQRGVAKLLVQQSLERKVSQLQQEERALDSMVSEFVSKLSNHQQKLDDLLNQATNPNLTLSAATELATSGSATRTGAAPGSKPTVEDVLVLASRLALMSFAPADYLERRGLSICRPPAPLDPLMAVSRLHLTTKELAALAKSNPTSTISTSMISDSNMSDSHIDEKQK